MTTELHVKTPRAVLEELAIDTPRIARNGHVVKHYAADPASGTPGMSFTVGQCQRSVPDLLVIGLPTQQAEQLLDALAGLVFTRGRQLELGEVLQSSTGHSCRITRVMQHQAQHFAAPVFCFAQSIGRPASIALVALPDATGIFPASRDCDIGVRLEQDLALHYLAQKALQVH